jgi:hypothetical protein
MRWSDSLSLALGSAIMFAAFGGAAKIHATMFHTAVDGNSPHQSEGDYSPRPH